MIETFQLPSPTPTVQQGFQGWLTWLRSYGDRLYNYLNKWEQDLSQQFNTLFNGYGQDIAAAPTMTVSAAVHQVTGTAVCTKLQQPPGQTAVSVCTLFAADGFTLGAGGNIAYPISVPENASVTLAYHPALQMWLSPGNPQVVVALSAQSPIAAVPGSLYLSTRNGANIVVNLSSTPQIGDWVYAKVVPGVTAALVLTPAAGFTIDTVASAVTVSGTTNSVLILFTGVNKDWETVFKST